MSEIRATAADAEVVMKLYDLRRESVMREARSWMAGFMPKSADEVIAVYHQWGSKENAYIRQVTSFWEMVSSLLLHGAVHPGVFWDWSNELIFVYAKFSPFLPELREKLAPEFLSKCEQAIHISPQAQKRLEFMIARQKQFAEMKAKAEAK